MANDLIPSPTSRYPEQGSRRNHGRARVKAGGFEAEVEVDISSRGLLAIGGMVSLILLSIAPIVVVATRRAPRWRHRPWG